ncbi:MAG: universal stress protein [Nitrososphaeria archaeon]|jgi:nucleotide-binding universal stress UspA family protein
MFSKLLLAYDGSENSKRALNFAVEIAAACGAHLHVIKVVDTATLVGLELSEELIEELRKRAERDVREAVDVAESRGVKAEGSVLVGDPVEVVLQQADAIGADLIVTGSRGLSTLKRVLLGSVSMGIVTGSKRPVLVVK